MPIDIVMRDGRRLTYALAYDMKLRGSAVSVYGRDESDYYGNGPKQLLSVVSVDAIERVERQTPVENNPKEKP